MGMPFEIRITSEPSGLDEAMQGEVLYLMDDNIIRQIEFQPDRWEDGRQPTADERVFFPAYFRRMMALSDEFYIGLIEDIRIFDAAERETRAGDRWEAQQEMRAMGGVR